MNIKVSDKLNGVEDMPGHGKEKLATVRNEEIIHMPIHAKLKYFFPFLTNKRGKYIEWIKIAASKGHIVKWFHPIF